MQFDLTKARDGILLVDKPVGWTSFDVVAKIRGQIRAEYTARGEKPTKRQLKVGHAGTLDPFATGLLVILIGDATKKADEFLKLDKVYEATIQLGQVSTTGDPEGEITSYDIAPTVEQSTSLSDYSLRVATPARGVGLTGQAPVTQSSSDANSSTPDVAIVREVLARFVGEITQTPPIFSAIKVNGQRAYKLAHKGQDVEIPSRQVKIYSIELLSYDYPQLRIRAHVGSGTYIRTLAQDIGLALGTGAYCKELRRISIADWSVDEA